MSRTLNKVMLIGNVGKEPELKYTPSGVPVTSFRLATSETWKDRDGNVQEHTDWHSVVAWRGLAEVIHKLVKKGSRIYIEGRLQTRSFDDKSGARKHIVEILADGMLLLDMRKEFHDELDDFAPSGLDGFADIDDAAVTRIPNDNFDDRIHSDNSDKRLNDFLF
jgi:single-strand DNA-binding protein